MYKLLLFDVIFGVLVVKLMGIFKACFTFSAQSLTNISDIHFVWEYASDSLGHKSIYGYKQLITVYRLVVRNYKFAFIIFEVILNVDSA